MSDISIRTGKTYVNEDQRWIGAGGIRALSDADSITLARSLFDFVSNFPNKVLPSGVVLGKVTSAGATLNMYGPYDDAATDGRQVAVGFLAVSVPIDANSTGNMVGPLYWKGEV